MKQKPGVSFYLALLSIALSVTSFYLLVKQDRKIGYVLVSDVFNEFELKKEMELKYTAAKNARKRILDSLQVDLSVLAGRFKTGKTNAGDQALFEQKRAEYSQKIQLFDEDNAVMSKQFDEQIIKQLNQYISDFGKARKYDIIYGNTSNGSIMYGTDELNVTKEAILFINASYKGLNK